MVELSHILLSAFPTMCFDIIILYIKLTTAYLKDTELLTVFSLLFFLNTLFCHIQTDTMVETQGIKGAQFHGEEKYDQMKKVMVQSIIILLSMYAIFAVPSIFFLKDILMALNMNNEVENLFESVHIAYLWMMIPLPFIMINENLKTYIQNEESYLSVKLGIFHLVIILIMIPITIIILGVFGLREAGYALTATIYEIMSMSCCVYLIKTGMKEKIEVEVEDYFEGIKEYFIEFLINAVAFAPIFLLFEAKIVIVAYLGTTKEIAVLGLYESIDGVLLTFSLGYLVVSRTELNNLIGKKDYTGLEKSYNEYKILGYKIGLSLFFILFLTHFLFLNLGFYEEGEFSQTIKTSFFFFSLVWLVIFNRVYFESVLRTIEKI